MQDLTFVYLFFRIALCRNEEWFPCFHRNRKWSRIYLIQSVRKQRDKCGNPQRHCQEPLLPYRWTHDLDQHSCFQVGLQALRLEVRQSHRVTSTSNQRRIFLLHLFPVKSRLVIRILSFVKQKLFLILTGLKISVVFPFILITHFDSYSFSLEL